MARSRTKTSVSCVLYSLKDNGGTNFCSPFPMTALEVAAQDWPNLYDKNFELYLAAYNKSKELE